MLWLRNNYANLNGISIFFLGVGTLGKKKIIDLWKLEVRRRILPKHNSILQRGEKTYYVLPLPVESLQPLKGGKRS